VKVLRSQYNIDDKVIEDFIVSIDNAIDEEIKLLPAGFDGNWAAVRGSFGFAAFNEIWKNKKSEFLYKDMQKLVIE
jgi:hypothetical protein